MVQGAPNPFHTPPPRSSPPAAPLGPSGGPELVNHGARHDFPADWEQEAVAGFTGV